MRERRDLKRDRNHRIELVHVGDIENEGLGLAGVQKTDRRSITRRQHSRFSQTVQTGSCLTQATIGQVGRLPASRIVPATLPANAVLPSQYLVKTLDARTLYPAKLIDGSALWSRLAETHIVHLAYDPETGSRIKRKARLMKQTVGASATRLPRGVQPDSSLPHPHQKTAHPRGKVDGRMRDTGARLQHQTRESPYRNVGTHSVAINYDEGAVEDIQPPFFNEENRCSILDRNGARRSDTRSYGHFFMPGE